MKIRDVKQISLLIFALFIWIPPYELGKSCYKYFIVARVFFAIIYCGYVLLKQNRIDGTIFWLVMYLCSIVVSNLFNMEFKLLIQGFSDSVMYINMFLLIRKSIEKNKVDTYKALLVFFSIYILVTMVQIGHFSLTINTELKDTKQYFVGGKFDTCYMFMLWYYLILQLSNKKFEKISKYFFGILIIILAAQTGCVTVLLGEVIFFLIQIFPKKVFKNITGEKIVLLLLCLDTTIVFLNLIVQSQIVIYIIQNIFGKDTGLTGRLKIYSLLKPVILKRVLFGYGTNSTKIKSLINFANTQNGMLQIIYNFGIVGGICFIQILCNIFRHFRKFDLLRKKHTVGIIIGFLVCSMVEITFGNIFMLVIAIIYAELSETQHHNIMTKNS